MADGLKLGACLELFFGGLPFEDRIRAASDAGLRYGEMWVVDDTFDGKGMTGQPKNPTRIRKAAEACGFTLTSAVIGSPDGSLGGGLVDEERRGEWLARTQLTMDFCREAGIGALVVCTGNSLPKVSREPQRASILEGLKVGAEKAEKADMDLFLEPLNDRIDHPGYFLTSSREGAELCREAGSARVKLLYDAYHMQVMEGDLCGHASEAADVLGHVHVAGHPGRNEPHLGEIHYPALMQQLAKQGYGGVVALEYRPTKDSALSLAESVQTLQAWGAS